MAFMQPVAEYFAAYHVETEIGTEIVPCDLVSLDEAEATFHANGKVIRDTQDNVEALADYLEGSTVYEIERREGWYARLSASGYLDCTGWDGPHATAEEALASVKDFYEVDDKGDPDDGAEDA